MNLEKEEEGESSKSERIFLQLSDSANKLYLIHVLHTCACICTHTHTHTHTHTGFAELQTDLDELTGDVTGHKLPYHNIQVS